MTGGLERSPICYHHDHGGGLSAHHTTDLPERIESEHGREGFLAPFLRERYLAGYLAMLQEEFPDKPYVHEELPEVIDSLLTPICAPGKWEGNGWKVELISSAAKYMAGEQNPRHWGAKKFFKEEWNALGVTEEEIELLKGRVTAQEKLDSGEQEKIDLYNMMSGKYGLAVDPDVDPLVPSAAEALQRLKQFFHIEDNTPGTGSEYVFKYNEHFTISAALGEPPPSAPWVKLLEISIIDTASGKRVFHLDVGEPPKKGADVERDARFGKTTKKQEEVRATLTVDNGHVKYVMSKASIDAMKDQDALLSESRDIKKLMEIFLRGLRMNQLHEVQQIELQNEAKAIVPLPNLGMFLPYFTSDTLLPFRRRLQDLYVAGERLPDSGVDNLKRELALCLTLDPYTTVQMLRDTGVGQFIPGLSHITLSQWEAILRSRHFVVSTDAPQLVHRTAETMTNERKHYLGRVEDGTGVYYNGVEMFMNTISEIGITQPVSRDTVWSVYAGLWRESEQPRALKYIADSANLEEYAKGSWLGEDLKSASRKPAAKVRLQNIRVLIDILSRFPTGLTLFDVEKLYFDWKTNVPKVDNIREIFCDLKLMGLVELHEATRIHKDRKWVENIARYTLRPVKPMKEISDIFLSKDFLDYLRRERYPSNMMSDAAFAKKVRDYTIMTTAMVKTAKIRSLQALETLKKKDMTVILARIYELDSLNEGLIPDQIKQHWVDLFQEFVDLYYGYIKYRANV